MTRADVAAAIFFVEQGRGKIEEVDPISLPDVLLNRSGLHFLHRNRNRALHLFMIGPDKFQHMIEFAAYAEGQCDAPGRGEVSEQGPESSRMVLDLVENQGGRIRRVLAI